MNLWPLFHNGVAAGLRISPHAKNIESAWILFNKPKVFILLFMYLFFIILFFLFYFFHSMFGRQYYLCKLSGLY